MKKEWLIWSIEHNAWWKPNENGYTNVKEGAGRYTYEDALRITKDANKHPMAFRDVPNEAMVPYQQVNE